MVYEYKVSELAEEFGVHRNTIRNWIKSGTLIAKKGPGKRIVIQRENYIELCKKFGRPPKIEPGEGEASSQEPVTVSQINHTEEAIFLEKGLIPGSLPNGGLAGCQSCGACSSACPISGIDGLGPRRIIRMAAFGLLDDLIATDWPWKCSLCGACEAACPMQVKIVGLMRDLRSRRPPDMVPGTIQQGITLCLEEGNNMGIRKSDMLRLLNDLGEDLAQKSCPGFFVPIDQRGARLLVTVNSKDLFADPYSLQHWWKIFYAVNESWTIASENWEGVNWGLYSGDDQAMHTMVGRIVDNMERLGCNGLLLPECGHGYFATLYGLKTWYPDIFDRFTIYSAFDLLMEYLDNDLMQPRSDSHKQTTTFHDSCNYGRKSSASFGVDYYQEGRKLTKACCNNFVEMEPHGKYAHCCGAGGGSWAGPFPVERVFQGRLKARQIRESKAELVIVACHTCRDQIAISLNREFDLNVQVKYIWELMADAIYPLPNKENNPQ